MSAEIETTNKISNLNDPAGKNIKRLKLLGLAVTVLGVGLFSYFVYTVGLNEIFAGIAGIGLGGFVVILLIYCLRIYVRSTSWMLSVSKPYKLKIRDTFPAVIIGEALSSMIPMGILISGTAKAVAVRNRIPIVVGFSSVATENLFFSFITGLFICSGTIAFLQRFDLPETWDYLLNAIVGGIIFLTIAGILMVVRQWHWVSAVCSWLYEKKLLTGILKNGRHQVRLFESQIYVFYRQYPQRFVPICLLQAVFHTLGILEVWFILSRIGDLFPKISTAFFLESISRLITTFFKLIPFLVGVDEAGAEFVAEALVAGVGIGVTLAIIRKGRGLFWAAIGILLIIKRGLSFKEIQRFQIKNE